VAEEKAKASESPAAAGAPAQKPILLIALLVLNMLVVGGVGAMLYLGKKKEAHKPTIDQVVQGEHDTQKKEEEKIDDLMGSTISMETFLINLAGTRGGKLAKITMEFEVSNELVKDEIIKRKPQIRDMIIIMLSSKSFDSLSSSEGKNSLRDEIRDEVNHFLTKGEIKRIFFTEFIFN
jgi:flagellar FliL protein